MILTEVARAETQGERGVMQDATYYGILRPGGIATLGAFDGHLLNGALAATQTRDEISNVDDLSFNEPLLVRAQAMSRSLIDLSSGNFHNTIFENGGTTAAIACIDNNKIMSVGIGDSSVYYISDDGKTVRLTVPHDGTNDHELTRVSSLGYSVQYETDGKVQFDKLYVTRALGDYEYDFVCPVPEISQPYEVTEAGYVLACTDGATGFGAKYLPNILNIINLSRDIPLSELAYRITSETAELTKDDSSLLIGRLE